MTATAHALTAAAIATKIPNPAIGLPLAFFSHFLLDKVPHWDPMYNHQNRKKVEVVGGSVADVLLSYLLVFGIFVLYLHQKDPIYIMTATFFSELPDLLEIPYHLLGVKWPVFYQSYIFQHWIHDVGFNARLRAPWGIITQGVIVALFLFWSLH